MRNINSATSAEVATSSPREFIATMIEHLSAKGWKGEQILQMIERHIVEFSPEHSRLSFGTSRLLAEVDFAEEEIA